MKTIGLTVSERIQAALIDHDTLVGSISSYPEDHDDIDGLVEQPHEALVQLLADRVQAIAASNSDIVAVGVAIPGLVRQGVVEEAPNLPQLKGARMQENLANALRERGLNYSVCIVNDADAMSAGLAARMGKLDHLIRVWTLGTGIGYGRYPRTEGVWEGGHTIITLDDKETFCGCGGRGHLEGIMGHRAMRLRFLDMEPEEVFEAAEQGDERCLLFKKLWHKSLAAATATSVHMAGPGKFYITGFNARFVDINMLKNYTQQMVKMSPLQSYSIEVVLDSHGAAIVGAGITAAQACGAM